MTVKQETLYVDHDTAQVIDRALKEPVLDKYETIVFTAKFDDGKEMDIKCCDAEDEPAWTEAVLFDSNGSELACSEVGEDFFGEWEIEYEDITYKADVRREKWLYRLEAVSPDNGLWYNSDNEYVWGCRDCKGDAKNLPMGYDTRYHIDGKNWFSSCSNKEDLLHWYSKEDAEWLLEHGFVFTRYLARDYHEFEKETVFLKETAVKREVIDFQHCLRRTDMNTKKELAERASDVLKQLKELDTLLGGETWWIRSQVKDAVFYTTGLRNSLAKNASMEKSLGPVPETAFAELDRLASAHPVSCWLFEEGAPNWYFECQEECGFTAGWLYSLLEDLKELDNFKVLAGVLAERDRLGKSEVNWYHELQSRVKEPSDEALRQWLESDYAVEPENYINVTRRSGDAKAWAYRCMCSALVTTLIKRMKNGGTHE